MNTFVDSDRAVTTGDTVHKEHFPKLGNVHHPPWAQRYLKRTRVPQFQDCATLSPQLQMFSKTPTFRIRHFMAPPCRASLSAPSYFCTLMFKTCITLQTCDVSHASEFPLIISSMICNSFKIVMRSLLLVFVCFPAFGVVHFQLFSMEMSVLR